jgi:biopolymer transport protein ExbB
VRAVVLGLLLAGCSFRSHATGGDAAGIDTVGIDTPVTGACLASGACRRKPITVRTVTGGPLADFVMLIVLPQDADLAGKTAAELQFTDDAGMPLSYERVAFAPASGGLTAWVRVPSLATGTTIYLWWGGTEGVDHEDRAGTWPAAYAGVWHLDEASGTALADSTANGNTATARNGATVGTTGVVASGVALDGTNDYLEVMKSGSLDATTGNATFALWTYWSSLTSSHYQRILASSNRFTGGGDGYEWASQPGGDHYIYPWAGDDYDYNLGPTPFVAGRWQYAVATLDLATRAVSIYVDGQPMAYTVVNVPTLWTTAGNPGDWLWGSNSGTSGSFGGMMDEIRVLSGVQTPGWIATTFANQHDPGAFLSVGAAETVTP